MKKLSGTSAGGIYFVGVSTADTKILSADGTTVNTGHLNGSMRNMELRLGRPLQRAVCTLHQAELPLRKMFEHLDGPTTGPRSYSALLESY